MLISVFDLSLQIEITQTPDNLELCIGCSGGITYKRLFQTGPVTSASTGAKGALRHLFERIRYHLSLSSGLMT